MFGLMKSEHFCGLKMFPFYSEHEETLFLRLFWGKTNKEKFWIFDLNRGLTPLENCEFWPYENFLF